MDAGTDNWNGVLRVPMKQTTYACLLIFDCKQWENHQYFVNLTKNPDVKIEQILCNALYSLLYEQLLTLHILIRKPLRKVNNRNLS